MVPTVLLPPAVPLTFQLTACLAAVAAAPCELALKLCVLFRPTVAELGVTTMVGGGGVEPPPPQDCKIKRANTMKRAGIAFLMNVSPLMGLIKSRLGFKAASRVVLDANGKEICCFRKRLTCRRRRKRHWRTASVTFTSLLPDIFVKVLKVVTHGHHELIGVRAINNTVVVPQHQADDMADGD